MTIAVDGQVFNEFKITNDSLEFNQPEVVFEATGAYSQHLRTFNNIEYVQLNPLATKKNN